MHKKQVWLVVADSTKARFIQLDSLHNGKELTDFVRVEGQGEMEQSDYDKDKIHDHKSAHIQHFAKEIAHHLQEQHQQKKWDHLYLIAPPSFLGHIRSYLTKEVKEHVVKEVVGEWTHFSIEEIIRHLDLSVLPV